MRVKDDFFKRGYFSVGSGKDTRFWEDPWLGGTPLSLQYPILYNIVRRKNVTVFDVLSQNPPNVTFRRNLIGDKWDAWLHLVERLMNISLNDYDDVFRWNLTISGGFTVKSLYEDFMNGHT